MGDDLNNIWGEFWNVEEDKQKLKSSKFWTKPVTPEVFFSDWLETPLFPRQQKAVNATFNRNYTMLSDKHNEFLLGFGKGCLHADTLLKDEKTKKVKTIKEWAKIGKPINLLTLFKNPKTNNNKTKIIKAQAPFKVGKTKLYKVKLKSGKEVTVSKQHHFKTKEGWKSLNDLNIKDKILINNNPLNSMSLEQELKRREKIANTMKGQCKTEKHIQSFKTCKNTGRFKKEHIPWNKGIAWCEKIKKQISKKLIGRKLPNKTRLKMSKANIGLLTHKKDCQCTGCRNKNENTYWAKKKYPYKQYMFRSSWEVKFAEYLDKEDLQWLYEPTTFILSNGRRYTPDFYIINYNKYIEIKGFFSKKSRDKIALFLKEFDIGFEILTQTELKKLGVLC